MGQRFCSFKENIHVHGQRSRTGLFSFYSIANKKWRILESHGIRKTRNGVQKIISPYNGIFLIQNHSIHTLEISALLELFFRFERRAFCKNSPSLAARTKF